MSETTDSQPASGAAAGPAPLERRIVTAVPGPNSLALHARRAEVVPPGVSSVLPVYIDRASGPIIVDVDGNHFLDCGSGIGVTTVGHSDPVVVAAAQAALAKMTHTLFTVTPYEGYVRVAELLAEHTPGDFPKRSLLVNSGAEAVENGVKIARKYTGRSGVAVLEHAYHGRTVLTMAMNFKSAPYATGYGPLASSVFRAPASYPYRDGLSGAEAAANTIAYLEKTAGASELACLVVEPIQGEGGFIVPAEGYLPALHAWCRENGIVFIADEIQSGMARTGRMYASEHFGVEPDLVLSAKGIAGGLPLAAVTGRAEIMDPSQPGGLGGTFGGNPVACAAAIAVFGQIGELDLLAAAARIEQELGAGLLMLQQKYDIIGEVRGRGAMLAMEFVAAGTGQGARTPNPDAVRRTLALLAERGVLALSCGSYDNVLRFLPSLTLTDAHIAEILTVLDDALAAVTA